MYAIRSYYAPLLDESPLNVECVLRDEVELGEYRLLLGEIVEIHAAEQAFASPGSIDARAFDPLVYLGGIRDWQAGKKVRLFLRISRKRSGRCCSN